MSFTKYFGSGLPLASSNGVITSTKVQAGFSAHSASSSALSAFWRSFSSRARTLLDGEADNAGFGSLLLRNRQKPAVVGQHGFRRQAAGEVVVAFEKHDQLRFERPEDASREVGRPPQSRNHQSRG